MNDFYKTLSGPVDNPDLVVLSLGAGVQSSTMALMAARGEIGPMPDCAIFSDTGWEPKAVYDWLDWLTKQLPFPVYRVSKGNIRDDVINGRNSTGQRFAAMPFFMTDSDIPRGMGRRQCTYEYKITPIRKKIRELLGLSKGQRAGRFNVELWMGISTDELVRMKESRDKWIYNRFPLIEEDMTRQQCLNWMQERQYPKPSKSSCIGCPFHNDKFWREMKKNQPGEFADAVDFDKNIRDDARQKIKFKQYLHRSCKPLDQIDFDNAEDKGQINFLDECEGMCGL